MSYFRSALKESRKEPFRHTSKASATDDTDYSLQVIKKLKQPTQQIPPIRKKDQNWARNDKEKRRTILQHV
jgi:hypothetical protein